MRLPRVFGVRSISLQRCCSTFVKCKLLTNFPFQPCGRPRHCVSGSGRPKLSAEKVPGLPHQDMSDEQILGPETVLEHGQAEQLEHGHESAEATSCEWWMDVCLWDSPLSID